MATAMQRLKRKPERPSAVRPGVTPLWDEFVLKCLSRSPERRYRTIDAALADFRAVLTHRQRKLRWPRPWWVAVSALLLGSALLGGALLGAGRSPLGIERYRALPTPEAAPLATPGLASVGGALAAAIALVGAAPPAAATAPTATVSDRAAPPGAVVSRSQAVSPGPVTAAAPPATAGLRAPSRRRAPPVAPAPPSPAKEPPRAEDISPSVVGASAMTSKPQQPPRTSLAPAPNAPSLMPRDELELDRGNPWEKR
jgi:hypothetical protein